MLLLETLRHRYNCQTCHIAIQTVPVDNGGFEFLLSSLNFTSAYILRFKDTGFDNSSNRC